MNTITILFTHRRYNPVSWLIRWAMPRTRFSFALSSHAVIEAGGRCFEANMVHGVRESDRATVLDGQVVVCERTFSVPDLEAGLSWARAQLCTYQPVVPRWIPARLQKTWAKVQLLLNNNYDWRGALGLSLAPDRDWTEPDSWFCYEFAAAVLRAAGRDLFSNLPHVGETALMAIEP